MAAVKSLLHTTTKTTYQTQQSRKHRKHGLKLPNSPHMTALWQFINHNFLIKSFSQQETKAWKGLNSICYWQIWWRPNIAWHQHK